MMKDYTQKNEEKIYKKRWYDVEAAFGNIKRNLWFTEFTVRWEKNVQNEFNLVSSAHNLTKLIKYMLEKGITMRQYKKLCK